VKKKLAAWVGERDTQIRGWRIGNIHYKKIGFLMTGYLCHLRSKFFTEMCL
jgi:hypothetical protein